jgi:hypothetical protein
MENEKPLLVPVPSSVSCSGIPSHKLWALRVLSDEVLSDEVVFESLSLVVAWLPTKHLPY